MACSPAMRRNPWSLVLVLTSWTTLSQAESPASPPPSDAPPSSTAPSSTAPTESSAAPGTSGKVTSPPAENLRALAARERAKALPEKDSARLSPRLAELAQLWERVQEELERALALERAADQKEREVVELEARIERARLLTEQTEARRARALARLKELEGAKK